MTIEIMKEETAALLEKNLRTGAFPTAEDLILAALHSLEAKPLETGAALVDAMRSSPCQHLEIEPPRHPMPVRDADLG